MNMHNTVLLVSDPRIVQLLTVPQILQDRSLKSFPLFFKTALGQNRLMEVSVSLVSLTSHTSLL